MSSVRVNDVHSALNPTTVEGVARPGSIEEVKQVVDRSESLGVPVALCGARHAMGGQQFAEGALLMDLRAMDWVGPVDQARGLVECGAGVTWPKLIAELHRQQLHDAQPWTIRQKQTGADELTLGGSLSANIHGRGLRMRPFVEDVESFVIVDGSGDARRCSRGQHADLFRLVVGGYGLFGVVVSIELRLVRRFTLRREVQVVSINEVIPRLEEQGAQGCIYGDFQFSIDENDPRFLQRGVLSCYRRVEGMASLPADQLELGADDWDRLVYLAHVDRSRVFDVYAGHYLKTHGQWYGSDTHQLSVYRLHYHDALDVTLGARCRGSEMISELYVPRAALGPFMQAAAVELRAREVPVIYGTVRLIERETDTFLAWAREDWACIIFNLHVDHSPAGIERVAEAFRGLIDIALDLGGTYFLTYHRWARREQVVRAYPQFEEFLRLKRRHDPTLRFQSDWWRHHEALLR